MIIADQRKYLYKIIKDYEAYINSTGEIKQLNIISLFLSFIEENPACFFRSNKIGHVTGSCLVINPNLNKILFTYHAKLKMWLQLGGHADGDPFIQNVVVKEAQEESGLSEFYFVDITNNRLIERSLGTIFSLLPFDLDRHIIPKYKEDPQHYHYDVRFILVSKEESYVMSEESLDLKWIHFDDVEKFTQEESTLRQIEKAKVILSKLN